MTSSIVDAHIATCQSVHWDLTLTLMNELVEGVLAICTGLSPYNRSSGVVHASPLAGQTSRWTPCHPEPQTVQIQHKSHVEIFPTFNFVYLCTILYLHCNSNIYKIPAGNKLQTVQVLKQKKKEKCQGSV